MAQGDKKKVLLVDDSRTVRQLLKLVLMKHLVCQVTEASDGMEAVKCMDRNSFDLLITDINMPVMNGLSLIRKIRGEMQLSVPIIIVTTMGGEKDRDTGLELGADSYVTKPINSTALLREAAQLLS